MTFRLKITLGDAAMQDGDDISAALETVADKLRGDDSIALGDRGGIMDANGNRVGEWKVGR